MGDDLFVAMLAGVDAGSTLDQVGEAYWARLDGHQRDELARGLDAQQGAPSPRLGVNRAHCRNVSRTDGRAYTDCDFRDLLSCQFGRYYQTIQHVAAMRGGVLRQFSNCDLVWRWLFNEGGREGLGVFQPEPRPIPAPAELYALLRDGAVLERFDLMLFVAAVHEVRLVPTLFTLDGGSSLNDRQTAEGARVIAGDFDTPSFASLREQSQYPGVILPSEMGWEGTYWSEVELGSAPSAPEDYEPEKAAAFRVSRREFARYALQLHPAADRAPFPDDYLRESARRKCLALAAFGRAIGEHLAEWEDSLGAAGVPLRDVVPYVELGNEMSVHWQGGGDASARELGWFMVLLAGAAQSACPSLRFAVPGVASWGSGAPETWRGRVEWVQSAMAGGVVDAVDFLGTVQEGLRLRASVGSDGPASWRAWRSTHPEQAAFIDTQDSVDFPIWPAAEAPALSSGDLLHLVSMHWYHPNDRRGKHELGEEAGGYPGEQRLVDDIDLFLAALRPLPAGRRGGSQLVWALTEYGFPAGQPTARKSTTDWCSFATPLFQAGKVVRLSLVALAKGASFLCWNTHMAALRDPSAPADEWSLFSTMGLRVDTVSPGADKEAFMGLRMDTVSPGEDKEAFRAAHDAFRRPAWYALRRLARIVDAADSITLTAPGTGLFIVRLDSGTGFELGSTFGGRTWPTAYVAWVDQVATADHRQFSLFNVEDHLRVPLAPHVDPPSTTDGSPPTEHGYAAGDTATWEWSGIGGSLSDWRSVADILEAGRTPGGLDLGRIDVTVHRDAATAPVPVLILCEHASSALTDDLVLPDFVKTHWGRDLTGPILDGDLLAAILDNPRGGVAGLRLDRLVAPEPVRFEPWSF